MSTASSLQTSILFTPDASMEIIQSNLLDVGYELCQMASYDELASIDDLLAAYQPAAVVAMASSRSAYLFEALRQHPNPTQRPLLILITDNLAAADAHPADLILPPEPAYIAHQLRTFLALRQQNQQYRARLDAQRADAEAVELLKNAIVRNVSHELRTPLLQVKSSIALLKEGSTEGRVMDYAEQAMARLEALVNNITALGNSLDANPGPIVVRDAVHYACRGLHRVWRHKHKNLDERLVLSFEEDLPPVEADNKGLSIVLQALLDNALKFSTGSVYVRAVREPEHVVLSVQDAGIGIAQDQLTRIFDMFFQVDPSSTRTYGGMGVGLALVKLILARHNSEIHVESILGQGSTFWFALPIHTLPADHQKSTI